MFDRVLDHWFWFFLSVACVAWYMTITIFVAVKGFTDIKSMFTTMAREQQEQSED